MDAISKQAQRERIIGEVVLLLPLFAIASLLGILYSVVVSVIIIPASKVIYDIPWEHHLHLPRKHCWPLTISSFIMAGIFSLGLAETTPFLANQPLVPVILSVGITLLWAYASVHQYDYRNTKAANETLSSKNSQLADINMSLSQRVEIYEAKEAEMDAFKLEKGCDKQELIEISEIKGLDCLEKELLVSEYAEMMPVYEMNEKYSPLGTPRNIRYLRKKAREKFERL